MKQTIHSFLVLVITLLALVSQKIQAQAEYIGSQKCGRCHTEKLGHQFEIWSKSLHSQAYKTLLTEESDKIARRRFDQRAASVPECLKCHVGEENLVDSDFKEDGVQCETCHGPGSEYAVKEIMENKEEAIKKGLIIPEEGEKFCKTCHNKEFYYPAMHKKMAHPLTKK